MTEIEIRRLYMEDQVWERTSPSWKSLKPLRNFNEFCDSDETKQQHYERLYPSYGIPLEVIEQWLYGLYYDLNSTNNYGWFDYERITFSKILLSLDILESLNVIKEYRNHVDEGATFEAINGLMCKEEDKEYWRNENTWRVPPIVLNVHSLANIQIPSHAEIQGRYQLVEGHSRLGYLFAVRNKKLLRKVNHEVYMMTYG